MKKRHDKKSYKISPILALKIIKVMPDILPKTMLNEAYNAFNNRSIDSALSLMHPDVNWPNGMEGGVELGHEAVRSYWTRQWQLINPHVEPVNYVTEKDGRVKVLVHQVVHDLTGNLLIDENVYHIYTIEDGLITKMEIQKVVI